MTEKSLTMEQGLEILAFWLEDNIRMESDLVFDSPEEGTSSDMLLPCVAAALKMAGECAGGGNGERTK